MHELLLNIENKEILSEILHHSVDYLIGYREDEYFTRFYHKYGFKNANDFIATTKYIAQCYRNACTTDTEMDLMNVLSTQFSNFNAEFQQLFQSVLIARRSEICKYNLRNYITEDSLLLKHFDWNLNMTMDDGENTQPMILLALNCYGKNETQSAHIIEMNSDGLDHLIEVLETAIKNK